MPRRDDLERIVILGSGPIRIGQAAELISLVRKPVEH